MIKLLDLIKEILQEESNPFVGKIVYHGSSFKLDLNSLDMTRSSIARNPDGTIIKETGSEKTGTGLYISLDLWFKQQDSNFILNPVYKEGTQGYEPAVKYAGDPPNAYIYQVELADDINLEEYNYKNLNGKNINKDERDMLLKEGIDGLYESNVEAVILNKDKIKSLKLAYIAKDLMTTIAPIKMDEITSWDGIPFRSRNVKTDNYKQIQIGNENVDKYLNETLKAPNKVYDLSGKDFIVTNAPKEIIDAVYTGEWDDEKNMEDTTKRDEARKKYPVKNYKFYYVNPYRGLRNWKKV